METAEEEEPNVIVLAGESAVGGDVDDKAKDIDGTAADGIREGADEGWSYALEDLGRVLAHFTFPRGVLWGLVNYHI